MATEISKIARLKGKVTIQRALMANGCYFQSNKVEGQPEQETESTIFVYVSQHDSADLSKQAKNNN